MAEQGESGLLLEVRWEWGGTEVSAAVSAGASTIEVLAVNDLTVDERVWPDGEAGPHTITDVNLYDSTIMIDPPLTVDLDEGDPIVPDTGAGPAQVWVAEVLLADADEPIEVPLTAKDLMVMPEGVYDPPRSIIISDDYERVIDLPGQFPQASYDVLDPDTAPDPVPPTPEPPYTPEFTLTGMPRGIMVQVTNGQPGWIYTYTITDHTDDETADITQVYPQTQRPLVYVEKMPDGTPLTPASNGYSFQVRAENTIGEFADSVQSDPQPLVLNDDNTIAQMAVSKLIAGDFIGGFALVGYLQVGNGITISDEGGIVISTPLGDMVLPTDGSNPIFKGEAEFDAATILGNFKLQGRAETGNANEIAKGAVLDLAAAQSPPKSPPTITSMYPLHAIHGGYNPRGLVKHEARENRYLGTESLFGATIVSQQKNANGDYEWAGSYTIPNTYGQVHNAQGGLAFNPTNGHLYVLCYAVSYILNGNPIDRWLIYTFEWTGTGNNWNRVGSRQTYDPGGDFLGHRSDDDPCIAYDAVNDEIVIAQSDSSNDMWVSRYDPATITDGGTDSYFARGRLFQEDGSTRFTRNDDVTGFIVSDEPDGQNTYYITFTNGVPVFAFGAVFETDARTRRPALEFNRPNGNTNGLGYFDGVFHTRHNLEGTKDAQLFGDHIVRDYSNITDESVFASQTWRKADAIGPDYAEFETTPSPQAIQSAFPRRAYLVLTSAAVPYDGTDPDTADTVTFYAGHTDDVRRQTVPGTVAAEEAVEMVYASLDPLSDPPPALLDRPFPDSTPAIIRSSGLNLAGVPTIQITGSGNGRMGPYDWNEDGQSTDTMIQLFPTIAVSGHAFYIKKIAPDTIAVSGYLDIDDSNTTRRDTGMRIPAGWEPPAELIIASTFATGTGAGFYRYFFKPDGVIEYEQSGQHNPYEGTTAVWFLR